MDNLRSMGFKMHIGSTTPLEKLKVLYRALFSQMRNLVHTLIVNQTCVSFSQMRNLQTDALPKYLYAKQAPRSQNLFHHTNHVKGDLNTIGVSR